ncbi:MAG: hypothetical protein KA764_09665 [Anaerolineales bacterium]|nr:hypothetical protein [Anaerolineales bacterium]
MTTARRVTLLFVGLAILALAAAALLYAVVPLPRARETARPAATLFAPP